MQNAPKLYGSRYSVDRDYPKEIASARKRLWEYRKSNYSKRDQAKIIYPAKLVVNGKCVADEFPDWQEVLGMDRLNALKQTHVNLSIYSAATDVDPASVIVPNSVSGIPTQPALPHTGTHTTHSPVNTATCSPEPMQTAPVDVSDVAVPPNQTANQQPDSDARHDENAQRTHPVGNDTATADNTSTTSSVTQLGDKRQ